MSGLGANSCAVLRPEAAAWLLMEHFNRRGVGGAAALSMPGSPLPEVERVRLPKLCVAKDSKIYWSSRLTCQQHSGKPTWGLVSSIVRKKSSELLLFTIFILNVACCFLLLSYIERYIRQIMNEFYYEISFTEQTTRVFNYWLYNTKEPFYFKPFVVVFWRQYISCWLKCFQCKLVSFK